MQNRKEGYVAVLRFHLVIQEQGFVRSRICEMYVCLCVNGTLLPGYLHLAAWYRVHHTL